MFKLSLALATLVVGVGALAEGAPATTPLRPETLAHAGEIRVQVTARYAQLPGRTLAVTDATTTGVVGSLTLVTRVNHRVVPAENGIYYSICTARARCPYPAPSASLPANAFLPRRQALELALRTFVETSASLVVVSLPTVEPVWVVFERDDLLRTVDAHAVLVRLAADPAKRSLPLRVLVDRLTRPRLFVPIPILPPSLETMYAVSLNP